MPELPMTTREWIERDYRPGRYDARDISPHQTELATSLRVPFVRRPPDWCYVTAVLVCPEDTLDLWRGQVPTEHEVRQIASFGEHYIEHIFPGDNWFKGLMREFAPYWIDDGANGRYLMKRPHGGWAWTRRTYRSVFCPYQREQPWTLVRCMDQAWRHYGPTCEEIHPSCVEWKAARPELFAVGSQS